MSKKSVVTNSTKSLSSNVSVISDDALNSYIKRISKIPVLSQQEELSLAKTIADGTADEAQNAKKRLPVE